MMQELKSSEDLGASESSTLDQRKKILNENLQKIIRSTTEWPENLLEFKD